MESLAIFVSFLLLAMLVLVVAVIALSILVAIGKIPKVIGYIAVGVQTLLTVFTFQLAQMMFLISLSILFIAAALVFLVPSKRR